jgi:hypothetical protein
MRCNGRIFAIFFCVVVFASATVARPGGDGERIHWKQLPGAQLKLDGKPPLTWNIYMPEKSHKKSNLVLVLLGHRYLAIDIKAKQVYQALPSDLQGQGENLESGDLFREDRRVPSESWTMRDVGRAERITFTMKDYGRAVEVLLPHTPDLRAFY